jgi:hypothetical protein
MSRLISELEQTIGQIVSEHAKLNTLLDQHHDALKSMCTDDIERLTHQQDAVRIRIAQLDQRRRAQGESMARTLKIDGELTLSRLAQVFPARAQSLLALKDKLTALVVDIDRKTTITGRLTSAVLGHLNTVVRLIAGAVEQAGVYTRDGNPKISNRIGSLEAIG